MAVLGEVGEDVLDEVVGHRGTRRHADGLHTVEPLLLELADVVDAVGRRRARLERDLDQAHRVRGVRGTDDDDQVGVLRDLLDRDLTVLGGVADVVGRRVLQLRELLAQPADGLHRLVDAQGGLREPRQPGALGELEGVDVVRALDEGDVLGRLARSALDLLVARVSDEQDAVVLGGETAGLVVDLGDEWARGVDRLQATLGGLLVHHRRDTVGGEHDRRTLGHLVELLDEHGSALGQRVDDVLVVHDLLADVHRRPVEVERLLDGDDRAVDAGAVAARVGEEHAPADGGHAEVHVGRHRCIVPTGDRPRARRRDPASRRPPGRGTGISTEHGEHSVLR